jgi:hypothetical protein
MAARPMICSTTRLNPGPTTLTTGGTQKAGRQPLTRSLRLAAQLCRGINLDAMHRPLSPQMNNQVLVKCRGPQNTDNGTGFVQAIPPVPSYTTQNPVSILPMLCEFNIANGSGCKCIPATGTLVRQHMRMQSEDRPGCKGRPAACTAQIVE